jgi:cobalamin biosynthesis Mg chelatase CobN
MDTEVSLGNLPQINIYICQNVNKILLNKLAKKRSLALVVLKLQVLLSDN